MRRGVPAGRARRRAAVAVAAVLATWSCAGPADEARPPGADDAALLSRLTVAEVSADLPDYDRELFEHWIDADGDGCDTREEVLIAESEGPAQVDAFGCKVVAGDWTSAYDGAVVTDPAELDADHFVPLRASWVAGAHAWDAERRKAFANDLEHPEALIAVTASSNRSKGDKDPSEWRPDARAYWCTYARSWITVKLAWDLTVHGAEKDALAEMLGTCSGAGVASGASAPSTAATPAPSTTAAGSPGTTAPPAGACDPNYEGSCVPDFSLYGDVDCDQVAGEVRIVGVDRHRLDGDQDGRACS